MSEDTLRLGLSVLVAFAITAGLGFAMWEQMERSRRKDTSAMQNIRLSLSALGPNVLMYVVMAPWWAFVYQQVAAMTSRSIGISALSLLAIFFACDLSYYVEHRCGHRIRILWRLHHGTHHHSELYNIPLAYRVNFLTQLTTPVFYIPWLLLGFHPLLVLGFQLFVFHYQAWIHTEHVGRLGVLDLLINTPAVHRMHHSSDPAHQAVNLGGVTLLWDHLLRSYCAPQDGVSYGVANVPATSTFSGIYLDPWQRR